MKRQSSYAERIYDTLFHNSQYPQLDLSNVQDQFVDSSKGEILIVYGRTAYRMTVERLKGYHDDITTISY